MLPIIITSTTPIRSFVKGCHFHSMKPTLTRSGGLFNVEVSTGAPTRRARWNNAVSFSQNKQIFLSTLPRTGYNTEVFSYFILS